MKLIDADALDFSYCDNEFDCIWIVDNAPTIDAVPVVRCGECLYYGIEPELALENYLDPRLYCGLHRTEMGEDSFCSYGERRNNG